MTPPAPSESSSSIVPPIAYETIFDHTGAPVESSFESPEVLFDFALKTDQVWSLEKICMGNSASGFVGKRSGMLFVNVETELIHELKSRGQNRHRLYFTNTSTSLPSNERTDSGLARAAGEAHPGWNATPSGVTVWPG